MVYKPKKIQYLNLTDDQIMILHSIMGGMLGKPNGIADLADSSIDWNVLPEELDNERRFLRLFYEMAGDRAPSLMDQTPVVITPAEMVTVLSLEIGPEAAQQFVDKVVSLRTEDGATSTSVAAIERYLTRKRLQDAFLNAANIFRYDGIATDQYAEALGMVTQFEPKAKRRKQGEIADYTDWWEEEVYKKRLEAAAQGRSLGPVLPWGMRRKIAMLKAGEVCTIAAKSSMGKTTVALQLSQEIAHKQEGFDVAYLFLETSIESQIDRLLSSVLAVQVPDLNDPRRHGFNLYENEKAWHKLQVFKRTYRELSQTRGRVWLDHCPGITTDALRARIQLYKQMAEAKGRQLVVIVDYYDLVQPGVLPGVSRDSRKHDINNALADWFKQTAELERIFLILFAQDHMDSKYADLNKRKTATEGQRIFHRSQTFIRMIREYAAEGDDLPYPNAENQQMDLAGQPMFWHNANQPHSRCIFRIEKASDGATGPVETHILGPYYTVYGTKMDEDEWNSGKPKSEWL